MVSKDKLFNCAIQLEPEETHGISNVGVFVVFYDIPNMEKTNIVTYS